MVQDNDLISREAAKNEFWALMKELTKATVEPLPDNAIGALAGYSIIENAPAVDAAPVIHAHWIYGRNTSATCSHCHRTYYDAYDLDNSDRYCRGCGALMDGE